MDDKDNKKVGQKPAQYKKQYPAQYKEYGGSGKGVEDSETEYNPVSDIEAGDAEGDKGSGKVKGPAGFNSYTDENHKHPHSEGGGKKMGYAQTWGAARKSGAARGAAAVAKVLGAALPDPDPDKPKKVQPFDEGDSYKPEGFVADAGEVVGKPKKNVAYKTYQAKDYSKRLPDTEIKVPTSSGGTRTNLVKNYETSTFMTPFSSGNKLNQGHMNVPRNSGFSSGNPQNKSDRKNMIKEFTDFMKQPTSSPRAVTQKLNEMKSGPKGGLMSDIKFYGGGGKKKHGKKHHNKK